MSTKVAGSVVRWVIVIVSSVGVFMGNETFMDAITKLKDSISSGDVPTIISSVVAVGTLGWSIWDKIKTQKTEAVLNAKVQSLTKTVEIQAAKNGTGV